MGDYQVQYQLKHVHLIFLRYAFQSISLKDTYNSNIEN